MNNLSIVLLGVTCSLCVLLGCVVVVRNPRKQINRVFLYFALALSAWIATNALFQIVSDDIAYAIGLVSYTAAALVAAFLLQFTLLFTGRGFHRKTLLAGLAGAFLAGAPNVLATSVVNHAIKTTTLLWAYGLFLVFHFTATILLLVAYRLRSRGLVRGRTDFIIAGFSLAIVGGLVFNLLLPLFNVYGLVEIGPACTLIMLATIAYAIIRHRLFDIRTVVLRTIAYLLFATLIGLFYVFVILRIGTGIFKALGFASYIETFYVVITLLIALSFKRAKELFDKATNSLFFQDAYDTQRVLDKLGSVLVKTMSLEELSRRALTILSKATKADFAAIYIDNHRFARHTFTVGRHQLDNDEIFVQLNRYPIRSLAVLEELEDPMAETAGVLKQAGVAVVAQLKSSREHIGYLLMGYKSNGSAYSSQDLKLVHIAADELSIAVQNALSFEKIARFNERLKQEVADATAELRATNKKLKALDEAKDEFISMASHQLRTPLTSVKGYLSMALEGDGGQLNTNQRHLLGEAYSSAQRMVYMIADLLNVSRLQTGKFILEPGMVDLPELIHEEAEQLEAAAKARGITLALHVPSEFPAIQLDENKIRQVIMNFLDNAIFYSKSGGTVTVMLDKTQHHAVFTVEDTGIGVPASEQTHLFTKFFRASNARGVRPDGTGIGLFVAKKVIDAHRGTLVFTSKENKGSTFGFTLPLKGAVKQQEMD